jgi:hypothetical protein
MVATQDMRQTVRVSVSAALPPVPELDPPPPAEVSAAIVAVRERLRQGRPFAGFAALAQLGAVVYAQLEAGAKQSAALVVPPRRFA